MKFTLGSIGLTTPAWATLLCLALNPAAWATVEPENKKKEEVASVLVSYADLDLTQQADVQILLDRIEKAAYRACGGNPRQHWTYGAMPELTKAAFKECREDTVARTISTLDSPALSQARAALSASR